MSEQPLPAFDRPHGWEESFSSQLAEISHFPNWVHFFLLTAVCIQKESGCDFSVHSHRKIEQSSKVYLVAAFSPN